MLWPQIVWCFGIQWVGWAVSYALQTEKAYDITGSMTYIFLVLWSTLFRTDGLPCGTWRQKVQAACVILWAGRLGSFLAYRVFVVGKDRRFDAIKINPIKYFGAWTAQGVWISLNIYPSMRLWNHLDPTDMLASEAFDWRDAVGFGSFAFGFVLQAVADLQKFRFKMDPANNGKWINTGLWSIVRHPNYTGELLMWSALWLTSTVSYTAWYEYFTFVCPMVEAVLIIKISGIPILEKYAWNKWGDDTEFKAFMARRNRLIPYVW